MTRRYGGSGLGLAICQSLLEAMGGELAAESTPGAGSTFSFVIELPRVEEERPAKASEPALEPDAPGVRVLYAEDNPANQKVVELILGAAGVDIDCVENGALAVEAWAQGAYDVILMDLQMPVMDGLSAIRAIRAREFDERRPRTPIYTLTANALPEQADAAFAAGVDGHLTKPTAAPTLLNAVVEALHLRGEPERSARA
jgi:CheY-like chemotaxis protein